MLGALGIDNATASVCAAVVALLAAGAKMFENHRVKGITGKQPERLYELVVESSRLHAEAG